MNDNCCFGFSYNPSATFTHNRFLVGWLIKLYPPQPKLLAAPRWRWAINCISCRVPYALRHDCVLIESLLVSDGSVFWFCSLPKVKELLDLVVVQKRQEKKVAAQYVLAVVSFCLAFWASNQHTAQSKSTPTQRQPPASPQVPNKRTNRNLSTHSYWTGSLESP